MQLVQNKTLIIVSCLFSLHFVYNLRLRIILFYTFVPIYFVFAFVKLDCWGNYFQQYTMYAQH